MAGWRALVVRSDARLSVLNGNVHLVHNDGRVTLPIDDLDCVLIESPRGNVSIPLLKELASKNIALLVVDDTHKPCGIYLPYSQNARLPVVLRAQIEASEPFKKRVWQRIVKQKILNSAACLEALGRPGAAELREVASEVRSGDSTNCEAYAARIYFSALLPGFQRRKGDAISAALDYGYAIVRSLVARSLAATGLQCALGLGHASSSNQFNLADDFVEVFRPFVDCLVFSSPPDGSFDSAYRQHLVSVLKMECSMNGNTHSVSTAATLTAQSYVRALVARDYRKVLLPDFQGLNFKTYE